MLTRDGELTLLTLLGEGEGPSAAGHQLLSALGSRVQAPDIRWDGPRPGQMAGQQLPPGDRQNQRSPPPAVKGVEVAEKEQVTKPPFVRRPDPTSLPTPAPPSEG